MTKGERAYTAFGQSSAWQHDGGPMPRWHELSPSEQERWQLAADAGSTGDDRTDEPTTFAGDAIATDDRRICKR